MELDRVQFFRHIVKEFGIEIDHVMLFGNIESEFDIVK